jgi:hypothetical protein
MFSALSRGILLLWGGQSWPQAAFSGGQSRLKAGCGQNCPPHKPRNSQTDPLPDTAILSETAAGSLGGRTIVLLASMLIAAAEWRQQHPSPPAGPLVFAAFGAGLHWGALLASP